MKKTIGILLLAVFVALCFTACSGSGGGSSIIDKLTGKKTITYSFANKNFGYKTNDANEKHFKFTSATAVTYITGVGASAVTKTRTYTDVSTKNGTLNITFTDGTTLSKAYEFTDDGNKVTGVMIDGLAYSTY